MPSRDGRPSVELAGPKERIVAKKRVLIIGTSKSARRQQAKSLLRREGGDIYDVGEMGLDAFLFHAPFTGHAKLFVAGVTAPLSTTQNDITPGPFPTKSHPPRC